MKTNPFPLGHVYNRDYKAEAIAEKNKRNTLKNVLANARENEIARICQTKELESDEFMTREEKAKFYTH